VPLKYQGEFGEQMAQMAHITDELESLTKADIHPEEKERLIREAGARGYISNLLSFIGKPDVNTRFQLMIISAAAKRERNQDLVWLLEARPMAPLVFKSLEEALFGNAQRAAEQGHLSDIILLAENSFVPKMAKTHARMLVGLAVSRGIERGYYQGFLELLGRAWVPEDVQIKAFDHWEKGRATDLDLELLLRENNISSKLKYRIVDALFERGASSRVPIKLKFRKLQKEREEERGELIRLSDFKRPRRNTPPPAKCRLHHSKMRRRKVC